MELFASLSSTFAKFLGVGACAVIARDVFEDNDDEVPEIIGTDVVFDRLEGGLLPETAVVVLLLVVPCRSMMTI